jgi:hypothetical protein
MKTDFNWKKQHPTKPGLYWVKSPDGTTTMCEHTAGVQWSEGYQFCGPILPPGAATSSNQPGKYAHLSSTGFVRGVRSRIKEKQTP